MSLRGGAKGTRRDPCHSDRKPFSMGLAQGERRGVVAKTSSFASRKRDRSDFKLYQWLNSWRRARPPNLRSQLFDFDPKLVGNQRRSAAFRPNLFIDVHPKPCFWWGKAAVMTKTRQRKQNLLTARAIEATKEAGRYSDGNGLYLVVRDGGSRQWTFLYRREGKLKEMGLSSPAKGVTLAMARDRRNEARAILAGGRDPLEARRQSEQANLRHSHVRRLCSRPR